MLGFIESGEVRQSWPLGILAFDSCVCVIFNFKDLAESLEQKYSKPELLRRNKQAVILKNDQ
jgi:hypothetical protein